MPAVIPWAIAVSAGAFAVKTIIDTKKQIGSSNKAAADASRQNAAAIQSVKDSQANASATAAKTIRQKASNYSQSVYTSPLGLSGTANTTRKTLLGQ